MDIHSNLILDNLREHFPVLCFGKKAEVPLLRPVFYGKTGEIEKNRIYVVRADTLPPRQLLDSSMLLICAEGLPSLAYQHCNTQLFVIRDASIMEVFNEVLAIFERYEIWEKSLHNILATNADIADLIQVTAPLLMNDITLVDKDLRVIAAANYTRNKAGQADVIQHTMPMDTMPLEIASKYRSGYQEHQNKLGSFFADEGCYCTNLYIDEQYWGNVSLYPRLNPLRQSDPYIFDILSAYILKALHIRTIGVKKEICTLENIVHGMLDGNAVDHELINAYEATYPKIPQGRFLCLCICLPDDMQRISPDYICQTLLKRFPNLIVFQHEMHLVGVMDFANCAIGCEPFLYHLQADIEKFNLRLGISNRFHHLRNIRNYHQQALCALELGSSTGIQEGTYRFQDLALRYMMINSSGSFVAKYLCPQGLLALQEHNKSSEVDYWHTLRCYLDSERNIAHASKSLGIHRNTMIQRIERIQSILDMDLNDPMNRLWLRMVIWLVDEEQSKR